MYGLNDAVSDGFLVPSENVAVPLRFPREGIRYDDLSDAEKDESTTLSSTRGARFQFKSPIHSFNLLHERLGLLQIANSIGGNRFRGVGKLVQ